MGCDIHCYPETKLRDNEQARWWCRTGQWGMDRDYVMFGLLAGVRGDKEMFPARGLPSDISFQTKEGARMIVLGPDDDPWDFVDQNICTRDNAIKWSQSPRINFYASERGFDRVDDPDWHSHSWVTLRELTAAITTADALHPPFKCDPSWHALLAYLTAYSERGHETRLVFWFDN